MKLMELGHVGVVIENKLIFTVCTELADVFRNSFSELEYFSEKYDQSLITTTIEKIMALLDALKESDKELSDEVKIELFNLMTEIIFNAEKIQYFTRESRMRKPEIIRRRNL